MARRIQTVGSVGGSGQQGEVSGGRLLFGIGAGGGAATPYAAEQRALGREVADDPTRRAAVEHVVATCRDVWAGTAGGVGGFLVPQPEPPVVVGGESHQLRPAEARL